MTPLVRALEAGRVVAAPTESVFGLLADATRSEAIDTLFRVKPRSAGVALMVPDLAAWERLVVGIPDEARRLARVFWPGPLTIVLPAATGTDPRLTVDGTVGVRLPGPSLAAELVTAFGRPLTATSANPSTEPPTTDALVVRRYFARPVDEGELLVADGDCPGGAPSTLVGVREGEIVLLRAGAIPLQDILAASPAGL